MPVFRIILAIANVVTGLCLLAGAFGGYVDPRTCTLPELFILAFPATVVVMLCLLVLDLIWMRMWAVGATLLMMLCLPSVLEVFPLNGPARALSPGQEQRSFSLMTYNVMNFINVREDSIATANATLREVLDARPDIVCLQEAEYFCPLEKTRVTQQQIDSVRAVYPHIMRRDASVMTVLSRYPLTFLDDIKEPFNHGTDILVFRADVRGVPVTVMSVHLQSVHYSGPVQHGYRDDDLGRVLSASALRADRAEVLRQVIDKYAPAGPLIICGDFNDVPGCYTLRYLQRMGLRSVHTRVGHGYMPTYNTARKFFTIDHLLYRGGLQPVSLTRGNIRNSDHYPLTARFLLP